MIMDPQKWSLFLKTVKTFPPEKSPLTHNQLTKFPKMKFWPWIIVASQKYALFVFIKSTSVAKLVGGEGEWGVGEANFGDGKI